LFLLTSEDKPEMTVFKLKSNAKGFQETNCLQETYQGMICNSTVTMTQSSDWKRRAGPSPPPPWLLWVSRKQYELLLNNEQEFPIPFLR
jgi:hypothetical protein